MPKEIIVTIDSGEVIIKKLPLGKYAEVFGALDQLPKLLGDLDKISNDEIISRIPTIISQALPELAKIISIATDLPAEEVITLGLAEIMELVAAVLEVNRVENIVASAKKIMARRAVASTGSTGPLTSSPANTTGQKAKS